jgi:hypothetical protein
MEHSSSNANYSKILPTPTPSSTNTTVITKVPGVDMAQVIPSRPDIVQENSSKPNNP